MTFDRECKIDLAVSDSSIKPELQHVCFTGRRLIATDGCILAQVPAQSENGDRKGSQLLPKEVFTITRKQKKWQPVRMILSDDSRIKLSGNVEINIDRPDKKLVFPSTVSKIWRTMRRRLRKDRIRMGIDPTQLYNLHQALGNPQYLELDIPVHDEKVESSAIGVRLPEMESYSGMIMPVNTSGIYTRMESSFLPGTKRISIKLEQAREKRDYHLQKFTEQEDLIKKLEAEFAEFIEMEKELQKIDS